MMRKGTTLIELVIALGIIITGLLTVVGLIVRSIDVGTKSRDEIVALGFAQEGIEAVRAIRDSNSLAIEADDAAVTAWNDSLYGAAPGDRYDYTGVPVLDYDYASFPGNLVDGPWVIDYSVTDITENEATILQRLSGSFEGLFFQDPSVTPDGLSVKSTQFERLITLEPICDSGNYLTDEPGHAAENLSSSDGCPGEQIGIHVISDVTWPDIDNTTQHVVLTQDLYDWR